MAIAVGKFKLRAAPGVRSRQSARSRLRCCSRESQSAVRMSSSDRKPMQTSGNIAASSSASNARQLQLRQRRGQPADARRESSPPQNLAAGRKRSSCGRGFALAESRPPPSHRRIATGVSSSSRSAPVGARAGFHLAARRVVEQLLARLKQFRRQPVAVDRRRRAGLASPPASLRSIASNERLAPHARAAVEPHAAAADHRRRGLAFRRGASRADRETLRASACISLRSGRLAPRAASSRRRADTAAPPTAAHCGRRRGGVRAPGQSIRIPP